MLRHYLLMALRVLARHRLYSLINIAGLSIGFACAILILVFVREELSYDRWIPDSANLYRVEVTFHVPGRDPMQLAQVPSPLPPLMQAQLPEVRSAINVTPESMTVSVDDRVFSERVTVVSPEFFSTIKLPLAKGDAATALARPESIVLSEHMARKYFGSADPLGKIMHLTNTGGDACDANDAACLLATHAVTVTGILRDLPANTQLLADFLVPNTSKADRVSARLKANGWYGSQGGYGYVALAAHASPESVLGKLKPIIDRTVHPERMGVNMRGSELEQFHLTPFYDVHLTTDNLGGMKPPGNRTTVYGFAVIALLIVLLACFNYMNLSTARATLRAREIGLRKTVGARRAQLMTQFLGEALLIALISLVLAISLAEVSMSAYATFLERPLVLHPLADWELMATILAGALAAGLLSGAYPALVLSSFRPTTVLRMSATTLTSGSGLLRTGLVIAQFSVSIALGIATLVVFQQIGYARDVDLGFYRSDVAVINDVAEMTLSAQEAFARRLRADPHIIAASLSNAVPFVLGNNSNVPISMQGHTESFTAHILSVDAGFCAVYQLHLLAGRYLSEAYAEDVRSDRPSSNVLANAEAVRRLGLTPDQAVGQVLTIVGQPVRIVGVLRDSLFDGMREAVQPTLYVHDPVSDTPTLLSVRARSGEIAQALAVIDQTWRSFVPGEPIHRFLITDVFEGLFHADERQGTMLGIFAALAVFIACLGLFGLALFTAARRTLEIGIRKIFGARTGDLLRLLLWQISIPVLIANVFAWPVAYYYLRQWLDTYAYRVPLSPVYFAAAGAVVLVIACVTVFAHTQRLATANPVHALRHE